MALYPMRDLNVWIERLFVSGTKNIHEIRSEAY